MKMLLSTTALVVALAFPTLALADSTTAAAKPATTQTNTAAGPAVQQQRAAMPGFLSERGQSDLLASELMGQDVYARRTRGDIAATGGRATMKTDGTHSMAMVNRANLEDMDNVGQINEIVLSHDGQVRAIVIGVGGFLGMGERDVAVTMDQVTFASDPDDRSQRYIVVNTGAEMLKDSPAYDRTARSNDRQTRPTDRLAMTTDLAPGRTEARSDRAAFAAPDIARDGYNRVEVAAASTEMLMGKSVYDVNDNDVGTVTDMILDGEGAIKNVVIDFGGFLGMGKSQASIGFDELTILSTEGHSEVRLYVDATKEQIQELPRYRTVN